MRFGSSLFVRTEGDAKAIVFPGSTPELSTPKQGECRVAIERLQQ